MYIKLILSTWIKYQENCQEQQCNFNNKQSCSKTKLNSIHAYIINYIIIFSINKRYHRE